MKIVILGAGKMGSFFADVLSFDHEIALYDIDPHRLRFAFNTLRMTRPEEIQDFTPDLVINAATVKYTIEAFQTVLPYYRLTQSYRILLRSRPDYPNFMPKPDTHSYRHTLCSDQHSLI